MIVKMMKLVLTLSYFHQRDLTKVLTMVTLGNLNLEAFVLFDWFADIACDLRMMESLACCIFVNRPYLTAITKNWKKQLISLINKIMHCVIDLFGSID